MGLFSSKYKTHVATTITRVIEDKDVPNSVKTGSLKSLVNNDEQMIENAMEELTSAIGVRANRMYEYGRNRYTFGLPKGQTLSKQSSKSTIQAAIEAQVGGPITIDYFHYGAFNNMHFGWVKVVQNYGYNTLTNELTTLSAAKGRPVFLKDLVVVVANATLQEMENGSLSQWGIQPSAGPAPDRAGQTWDTGKLRLFTPFEVDAGVNSDYVRVEYSWTDAAGAVQIESLNITVAGMDDTADYYQVKYVRNGVPAYWIYQDDSGGLPVVDALYQPQFENTGTYYPWVYFRFNNTSQAADKTSDSYKHAVRMCKYLNMSFDDVHDAIHENPDINKVEQAMLMMCVPATTTNQLEMRYLFDFFKAQWVTTGGLIKPIVKPPSGNLWKFMDSSFMDATVLIQDERFKLGLGYRNIFRTLTPGLIGNGKIGNYSSGSGTETVIESGKDKTTGAAITWETKVKYHWYRKQITASVYEEIRVLNLRVVYHIYEQYSVTADELDDILLIPMDKAICSRYSIPDREVLFARSLHYVFNSKVVQEIKWYQQSWFKYLMIIVAIIITIISWGQTIKMLLAAIAIGTTAAIMAVIYAILVKILQQLLISYLIKLFVKVVGIKIAFIVAIIAVLYGGYQAIQAGSVQGAPWATELLAISTSITSGVQESIKDSMDGLRKENESFKTFVTHEEQRIKDAEKLLEQSHRVAPMIIFGETPQEYFQRTVHSGNIGPLGIDAISSYVDVQLTLPTLTQTLGEINDG